MLLTSLNTTSEDKHLYGLFRSAQYSRAGRHVDVTHTLGLGAPQSGGRRSEVECIAIPRKRWPRLHPLSGIHIQSEVEWRLPRVIGARSRCHEDVREPVCPRCSFDSNPRAEEVHLQRIPAKVRLSVVFWGCSRQAPVELGQTCRPATRWSTHRYPDPGRDWGIHRGTGSSRSRDLSAARLLDEERSGLVCRTVHVAAEVAWLFNVPSSRRRVI